MRRVNTTELHSTAETLCIYDENNSVELRGVPAWSRAASNLAAAGTQTLTSLLMNEEL